MSDENKKIYPAVIERQDKQKELIIEQLKKTPIIQIVCEKIGISRATFYRWKQDDAVFAEQIDQAIFMGVGLINDMAESQLLAAIREQNMTAIIFWLKHRHRAYGTRVELGGRLEIQKTLSEEEAETIRQALKLASLSDGQSYEQET